MNIVRAEDYHVPVMLQECLEGMQLRPEGCYVDVTFGGGGHSRAILGELQGAGMLYSFDQDPDAAARAPQQPCFTFIASNFRHLARFMDYYDRLGQVDAILADLGVSSHHFDAMERGFSFRDDTPLLDMRMNNRAGLSARDLVNSYEEEQLADVLYRYGELKQSRSLARLIVKARAAAPLQTGGRLVVMTYHSLEDRIVKNFLKGTDDSAEAQIYGTARSAWRLVTRKPLVASAEELERNPRSRSAKLRIAERIR